MQNLGQILFVMWRESVEAMLVVGILYAWLAQVPHARRARLHLWLGVLLGLGFALLLGLGLEAFSAALGDEAQDYLQAAMQCLAAALIVHMVLWMRRNGATLRRDLHGALQASSQTRRWWGVTGLAALAVAREGSETVVFLSGLLAGQGWAQPAFWLALALGLALAGATFAALQWGGRRVPWQVFFRTTEIVLLLLGGALLVAGVERLVALQFLPALLDPAWDSSGWLADGTLVSNVLGAFTGYRAQPSLLAVLVWLGYWAGMARNMWPGARVPGQTA